MAQNLLFEAIEEPLRRSGDIFDVLGPLMLTIKLLSIISEARKPMLPILHCADEDLARLDLPFAFGI